MMTLQRTTKTLTTAFLTMCLIAPPALAQTTQTTQASVSTADIQRLQDEVYQAGVDLSRLRTSSATETGKLQDELDTLRDETIYLKVKLRKEGSVKRSEYSDLRDRLQDL